MVVGIQETEHFESVYPVIRLFDNGSNQLFLFVPRSTYLRLQDLLKEDCHRYSWVIQEPGESTFTFCEKIFRTVKAHSISLLYLNTVSKHHLFYAWMISRLRLEVILTVHNVNCLFRPLFSLHPRLLLQFLGKKWLTGQIRQFNTISSTVQPALEQCAGAGKKVWTIPGAVFEKPQSRVSPEGIWSIVVPGTLDKKRRNYDHVFDLLDAYADLPIHITLLGGGADEIAGEIRKRASDYRGRLTFYTDETVHQDEYDRVLQNAHLIWIPAVIHTAICGSIPEQYGITKSSGVIFDIIKHAKPFLYYQELVIPSALRSSGLAYSGIPAIREAIERLMNNPDLYFKMEAKAADNSQHFTVSNIRMLAYPLFGK